MEEFAECASDDSDDDDDDFDEVDRYINTKISFSKDDALLKWWSKHSLIFPQLSFTWSTWKFSCFRTCF
jgi:hypothetical protein